MITGGYSWLQIIDGYQMINQILDRERQIIEIIAIDPNRRKGQSESNLIPIHEQSVPASVSIVRVDDCIYLHKVKIIKENPRNYFLLKQWGLLPLYIN